MSEPKRWLDDGSDASHAARSLLVHALAPGRIPADVRARSATNVARLVAAAPFVPWFGASAVKLAAGVLLLGVAGTFAPRWNAQGSDGSIAAIHTSRSTPARSTPGNPTLPPAATARRMGEAPMLRVVTMLPPAATAPREGEAPTLRVATTMTEQSTSRAHHAARSGDPPSDDASTPDARRRDPGRAAVAWSSSDHDGAAHSVAATGSVSTAASSHDERVRSETEWLALAHASLAADPDATLRTIDALAVAYPNGRLLEEREFLAISALHRAHRDGAARERATSFLGRFGSGLYATRVRALIEQPR